jgi:hypothetical protein
VGVVTVSLIGPKTARLQGRPRKLIWHWMCMYLHGWLCAALLFTSGEGYLSVYEYHKQRLAVSVLHPEYRDFLRNWCVSYSGGSRNSLILWNPKVSKDLSLNSVLTCWIQSAYMKGTLKYGVFFFFCLFRARSLKRKRSVKTHSSALFTKSCPENSLYCPSVWLNVLSGF